MSVCDVMQPLSETGINDPQRRGQEKYFKPSTWTARVRSIKVSLRISWNVLASHDLDDGQHRRP